MKKKFMQFSQDSPEYVVGHAEYKRKRGKGPSMPYSGERNSRKALAMAEEDARIASGLAVTKIEKVWYASGEHGMVAKIHLNYQGQVSKVMLYDDRYIIRRMVTALALSHAIQFVSSRPPMLRELISIIPDRPFEEINSDNLMDFNKIPRGIIRMDSAEIENYLRELANVERGVVPDFQDAFLTLSHGIAEKYHIHLEYSFKRSWDDEFVMANLRISSGQKFRLWNHADNPHSRYYDPAHALHIIPGYHPAVKGWKEEGLINGDTDYLIRGDAITRVLCPEKSKSRDAFGSSWGHTSHPFYAEGPSMGIEVSKVLITSQSGYESLWNLVVAALQLENTYLAVSGGFQPPYDYPSNILQRKNLPSPAGRHGSHDCRGSEHHCVWEYLTLKKERKLKESFVPAWFLKEGWLEIYSDKTKRSSGRRKSNGITN